jgi:hypothetical protein
VSLRELRLTDLQLRACSLWTDPDGSQYLPVYKCLPFYFVAPANPPTTTPIQDTELGTPPRYRFLCKVISAAFSQTANPSIPTPKIQIQWPDGRYLSNPALPVFSFVGTGKNGRLVWPHKMCPPSSKLRMNVDNTASTVAYQVQMFFEGCLLVPLTEVTGSDSSTRSAA